MVVHAHGTDLAYGDTELPYGATLSCARELHSVELAYGTTIVHSTELAYAPTLSHSTEPASSMHVTSLLLFLSYQ
eukprot:1970005-Rhodomonas_salina.1